MKQPDDPGPGPHPLDEPHPFDRIAGDLKIRVYLALIIIVIIATAVMFWTRAEAQEAVPLEEPCNQTQPAGTPCRKFNQATLWVFAGDVRKIGWSEWPDDVATMVLDYELEVLEFPPKDLQVATNRFIDLQEGTTSLDWTPIRAGAYWARIRACRSDIAQDGEPIEDPPGSGNFDIPEQRPNGAWVLCSIWATSIDSTHTSSTEYPRGFIFFATVPPATGGGIE